jgi:hypothetical protein
MDSLRESILYLSIILAIFGVLICALLGILLYRRCCSKRSSYRAKQLDNAAWHLSWKDLTIFQDEENVQNTDTRDALSLCSQVSIFLYYTTADVLGCLLLVIFSPYLLLQMPTFTSDKNASSTDFGYFKKNQPVSIKRFAIDSCNCSISKRVAKELDMVI